MLAETENLLCFDFFFNLKLIHNFFYAWFEVVLKL